MQRKSRFELSMECVIQKVKETFKKYLQQIHPWLVLGYRLSLAARQYNKYNVKICEATSRNSTLTGLLWPRSALLTVATCRDLRLAQLRHTEYQAASKSSPALWQVPTVRRHFCPLYLGSPVGSGFRSANQIISSDYSRVP